jgi:hypothetical protein
MRVGPSDPGGDMALRQVLHIPYLGHGSGTYELRVTVDEKGDRLASFSS